MSVEITVGDCRDKLREMADESVHCCVTSPPYWGLRDYGVKGMIGLEERFDDWLAVMVEVFREVRRVLRKDGTLWLNIGDAYAGSPNGRSAADTKALGKDDRTFRDKPISTVGPVNNSAHDGGVWKAEGYQDAFRNSGKYQGQGRSVANYGYFKPKDLMMMPARLALALQADGWWLRSEIVWAKLNPMPESVTDRPTSAHEQVFLLTKSARYFYDAEGVREAAEYGYRNQPKDTWDRTGVAARKVNGATKGANPEAGRNLRNVWNIATAPFPEAHFATFPPALVEPCIKAGTSERGVCGECGAPWVREIERQTDVYNAKEAEQQRRRCAGAISGGTERVTLGVTEHVKRSTLGWSLPCACKADPVPATILDPFGGAGTTGLVADRLGRNAVLIELNPDYAAMARKRIDTDAATRGQGPEPIMRGDDMPLFAT